MCLGMPLDRADVDTDQIIRKKFLKLSAPALASSCSSTGGEVGSACAAADVVGQEHAREVLGDGGRMIGAHVMQAFAIGGPLRDALGIVCLGDEKYTVI